MSKKFYRFESFFLTIAVLSSITILFLLAPIIALFLMMDPMVFEKALFKDRVLAEEAWAAFYRTMLAATLSSILLLVIGIPLAYILARKDFPGKNILEGLIDIPLMIPHAVAGIMILVAYSRRGLFSSVTSTLGIPIADSFWGIVAVMLFVSAPIMIDTVKVGIQDVDPMYEYIARSLGASPWRVFFTVTLPISFHSIIAGFILSWARAVSEVGAILIVAYYPKTINVLVIEWFNTYGLQYAIALSIVLVVVSLILFTLLRMVVTRR
ncbi:ABC transporter permease [Desulfurococcaceae archaeon MEX13E-LK6-19]|nr:ABC transporter permease [Desulfurococcaceae archaeon MEX13E-LK6-19]